jgi:long-chain acyl-CoA synthetase
MMEFPMSNEPSLGPRAFPAREIREVLQWPDGKADSRLALRFEGNDLSYGALDEQSRELAAGLEKEGIQPGDRVAAYMPNCLEIYQLYFATAAARGIFLAVNQALTIPEVAYLFGHAKPALLFTRPDLRPQVEEALSIAGHRARIIEVDMSKPSGSRVAFLGVPGGAPSARPEPDDICLISYSSGTTSNPKAIAYSNRVEVEGCDLYRQAWDLKPEDRVLIALSLGWTYGINPGSFPAFRGGATIVLLEKFNPVRVLESIETEKVSVFMGVPTMYGMMIEHVEQTGKAYDLSSLRLALCAGSELPTAIALKFEQLFGIGLTNFLGISEVKLVASPRAAENMPVPVGSVGVIPPGVEIRLVDEHGQDVPAGEPGEILVKSPGWMAGYYLEPEKTAAARRDGWFLSGDLGRFDESGFFYMVGRNRDQIIRGGAKIAPAEVEDALSSHPDIVLSAVIGIPDPLYGEEVKAFVISRNPALAAEALQEHCRPLLSSFKIPTRIEFVDELPLGPTGKVLKKALKRA